MGAPAAVHALWPRRLLPQLSHNRHATAHWHDHPDHPVIGSYEPKRTVGVATLLALAMAARRPGGRLGHDHRVAPA
jgi:hypothetical protein